jgi:hypothetical protein
MTCERSLARAARGFSVTSLKALLLKPGERQKRKIVDPGLRQIRQWSISKVSNIDHQVRTWLMQDHPITAPSSASFGDREFGSALA